MYFFVYFLCFTNLVHYAKDTSFKSTDLFDNTWLSFMLKNFFFSVFYSKKKLKKIYFFLRYFTKKDLGTFNFKRNLNTIDKPKLLKKKDISFFYSYNV